MLGVIHIICGLIALGADIGHMFNTPMTIGCGYWTHVFFFISGGLAIGGARSGNKCLVVATMVMSIISALFAGILLLVSAIHLSVHDENPRYNWLYNNDKGYKSALELLVAMGVMMMGVAIASASLTCKPLCCRSTNQGSYNPNQVPTSVLVNPNYNPNPNAQVIWRKV